MKKALLLFLILLISTLTFASCSLFDSDEHTPEGVIYRISTDKTYAEVVGYDGTMAEVEIAEEYGGLPVKNIYDSAFRGNKTITSVVIPDSVTSIGGGAFAYCSALTSVVIPNSVTSIGTGAFYGGNSLQFNEYGNCKYLGNSSNPYLVLIEASNKDMSSYEIHNYARVILENAFYCCSLTSVVIPDSVTSVGDYAFRGCNSLTSVVMGNSVTNIGQAVFYDCYSLNEITVDEKNEYYKSIEGNLYTKDGKTLLQYAIGKTSTEFSIPNSVTSIGKWAFYGCSRITSVIIPESVTYISDYAFWNCSCLTSIIIPDSVTSIGEGAFLNCSALTSIVIGASVTSIGEGAFMCNSLNQITVTEENAFYKSIEGNLYTKDGKKLLQYAIGKDATEFYIPDSVTSIGDRAFENCSALTSVVIPDSVTHIDQYAFKSCTSLTSVVIPDSVTSIDNYAFVKCSALTSAIIGNSVTSIGNYAFYGCDSLTSVVIPDSVTSIGNYAFYYCDALTDVYYTGSEEEWSKISISEYNEELQNATIHYNYVSAE